jgi:hypothetical protein
MDAIVKAALEKWPNVPHAYGWLSLDEHGNWALKGSPIENATLIDFIGRNYDSDETGRWFFQNGPQRVYVTLAQTPYVLSVAQTAPQLSFATHTGRAVDSVERVLCDANQKLYLLASIGRTKHLAIIASRELAQLATCLEPTPDGALTLHLNERDVVTVEPFKIDVPTLVTQLSAQAFNANPRPAEGEPEC